MRFVFVLILFTFSLNLLSQESLPTKYGLVLGGNFSIIEGDRFNSYSKLGFSAGVFMCRPFRANSDFVMELLYNQKGSVLPSRPDKGQFNYYKISAAYLEVPLLYKLFYKDKVFFEVGPSLGFKLSQKERDANGVVANSLNMRPFELGLNLGVMYPLSEKAEIGIRYSRSILPIANQTLVTRLGVIGGAYNSMFIINMRYYFG
jgi:hypothetical protein